MLNSVVLIGRLTKDPELRYTPSGRAVATLRLAVDRGTTNPQGEKETNYLQKGRLVAVQGRLQIRQWTTDDGQRRERAEVVANQVRFLDRGKDGDHGAAGSDALAGELQFNDDDDVPF